jgi:acylphosphatase
VSETLIPVAEAHGCVIRATASVDGVVQGVGFRYHVRNAAVRRGLKGRVRNLEDGRVEIVVEGERSHIDTFLEEVKGAKRPVEVTRVETSYGAATGEFPGFQVHVAGLPEEMVEGFSTGASYLRILSDKQDQTMEMQRETLSEVRGLRTDLNALLDERLVRIERELAEIRVKVGLERR